MTTDIIFVLAAGCVILPPLAWMWGRDVRLNRVDDERDREVRAKIEACKLDAFDEVTMNSLLDGLRDSEKT